MSWRCWVPVPPFNKEPCQWQTPKLQPQKENFCEIEMLQNILNQIPLALLSLFSSFSTSNFFPFPWPKQLFVSFRLNARELFFGQQNFVI